jgi:hypothetical protein
MEHDDQNKKMTFSTMAAKLGFVSYVILLIIIVSIFIAG